eukprot:tig00000980_g6159.t1
MAVALGLGLTSLLVAAAAALVLSVIIVRLFLRDASALDDEGSRLRFACICIAAMTIASGALLVLLAPVDVYFAGTATTPEGRAALSAAELAGRQGATRALYYCFLAAMLLLCFVAVPFLYFFLEGDEEEEGFGERVFAAMKYTSGFVLALALAALVGLVLRPGMAPASSGGSGSGGDAAVSFTLGLLAILSYAAYVYVAYGMAILPVTLLKNRLDLEEAAGHVAALRSGLQERLRAIRSRYELEERAGLLERRQRELAGAETLWDRLVSALAPARLALGVAAAALSLLLAAAVAITSIDKAANSVCGLRCGFVLDRPRLFNPLDALLTAAAAAFPLDLVLVALLAAYVLLAALAGLSRLGLRLLWLLLYPVRPRRTSPQGLLLAAAVCGLIAFLFAFQLPAMAPQYSTFGAQTYADPSGALPKPKPPPSRPRSPARSPSRSRSRRRNRHRRRRRRRRPSRRSRRRRRAAAGGPHAGDSRRAVPRQAGPEPERPTPGAGGEGKPPAPEPSEAPAPAGGEALARAGALGGAVAGEGKGDAGSAGACVPSVLAQLVNRMTVNLGLFSGAFFVAACLFVLACGVSGAVAWRRVGTGEWAFDAGDFEYEEL